MQGLIVDSVLVLSLSQVSYFLCLIVSHIDMRFILSHVFGLMYLMFSVCHSHDPGLD